MMIVFYTLYSVFSRKLITPFDFYEWLFFAPGHKSAWLVFFSFGAGFFVAMTIVTKELMLLYPAVVCLTTILTFGLKVAQPQKEITKTLTIEKIVTVEKVVEKKVFVQPGSNCGVIYIMRRADGILKFGKAQRLEDRLRAHCKDYQSHFEVVSSWIVPDMDRFEAMALAITGGYFYREAQRRELRRMTEGELTRFILDFTDKVQRGWTQ